MKYNRSFWETGLFLDIYESLWVLENLRSNRQKPSMEESQIIDQTKDYIREISSGMTNLSDSKSLYLARRTLEILDLKGIEWAEKALSAIRSMLRSSSFTDLNTRPSLKEEKSISHARKILNSYYQTLEKISKGEKVSDEELDALIEFLKILSSDKEQNYLGMYSESKTASEEPW